jgi:hypothetical protein
MKSANVFILALTMVSATALTGCSKGGADPDDKSAAGQDKTAAAEPKPGVTLDAETQERIGLRMENPAVAQWQPGIHVTGRVANPLAFISALTDYETARSTAAASESELARTKKLAAQENASARMLEGAQTAATHDALALKAAEARFTADWGANLAGQADLSGYAGQLQAGSLSLVKLTLPAGTFPDPLPQTAVLSILGRDTNAVAAEFTDNLLVDPATQVQTLLFTVKQKLPPEVAVEGHLNLPGEPVTGVVVPSGAILRYEGQGWVYVQTESNQFVRAEVPLDRLLGDGWFVSDHLSTTNHIVVTGAQSVLSAELSAGGFSTGQRD